MGFGGKRNALGRRMGVNDNNQTLDDMNRKVYYEAPQSEVFWVKLEGSFLASTETLTSVTGSFTGDDDEE